jgi:hypothetical protein
MTEDIILTEDQRRKLDSIVQKMVANNESDSDIQFVVNDFKKIYGVKKKESTPSESDSGSITSKSGWQFPTQGSLDKQPYFAQKFEQGVAKPVVKAKESTIDNIFEMDPGPQAPAQKTEFQKQKERMNKALELDEWNKMTEEQKVEAAKYNQDKTAWQSAQNKPLDKGELFTFLDEDQKKEASLVSSISDASSKEKKYADIYNQTNDPSSRSLMIQSKYDKDMATQKYKSYMTDLYKSIDEQIAVKEKILSSIPEGVDSGATRTLKSEIETLQKKKETFFKNKDAQIVSTYTEVAPEIKKFNIPGNTPQEKIENYAKFLREKAQKIWDEYGGMSNQTTDAVSMATGQYGYLQAKSQAPEPGAIDAWKRAFGAGNIDAETANKKMDELAQIDQQLRAIAPVVLINKANDTDGSYDYFDTGVKGIVRGVKSFARGITGGFSSALSNPEERAQSLLTAISDANLIDNVSDATKKSLEQQVKGPSMLGFEGLMSTVGTSLAIVPYIEAGAFMLNTARAVPAVTAALDALAVSKYGRYLVNHSRATASMLESNKVASAVQAGVEMSIAGDIAPKGSAAAEDANFMSGLIGKFGEQLAGSAINTLSTSDAAEEALAKMFGGASTEARAFITALGKRVGGAVGETVQEYGESVGSFVKLYMEKGNWADVKKEIENQFGTVDKNVEFAASSFIMGFTWGRTGLGKAAMDLYNKGREELSPSDQAKLDRFTNDVYRNVMDAEIVAKVEAINQDPSAANYTPVTAQDLDRRDAAEEIIKSTTTTQGEKVEAARIIAEINGRQKQEQVTKAAQALMSNGEQVQAPTEGETLMVTPEKINAPVSNYVYRNGQWNKVVDNKTETIDTTEQQKVQEFYDSQNKSRIPGQIRIGEESVQAQLVEGSSTQATPTNRNVQASEKVVNATDKILRQSSSAQKSTLGKMENAVKQVAKSLGISLEGKPPTRAISEVYQASLAIPSDQRTKAQSDIIKAVDVAKREGAAERVGKSLKDSGVKVKFVTSEEMAKESQSRGGEAGAEGVFLSDSGEVLIDKDNFEAGYGSTVIWHEGSHPILNIIKNTDRKLYDAAIRGLKEAVKASPKSGLQEVLDWANREYAKDGDFTINDEGITETMARISDGKIDLDAIPKSAKQSIINFINKISKALGLGKVLSDTSDLETFRNLAKEISDVLTKGKDVAKVVGKKNVGNYASKSGAQSRRDAETVAKETEEKVVGGGILPSMILTGMKDKIPVELYRGEASMSALKEAKPGMYISRAEQLAQTHLVGPDFKGIDKNATKEEKAKWADTVYEKAKQTVVSNLLFIHDNIPSDIRAISKLWYDGANIIAQEISNKYGVTLEQSSAIIATQSPQKPWYDNVHLAHFIIDFYSNNQNTPLSQEMFDYYKSKTVDPKTGKSYPMQIKYLPTLQGSIGKPLKDIPLYDKAAMIRAEFDLKYDRNAPLRLPNGVIIGKVKSMSSFSGYDTIVKALSILENGSPENISKNLGEAYKVRNFNNNIVSPKTDNEVTIDTHAIAASYMLPLGANSAEVKFDEATYAFFADAYRQAAKDRGILAREMQSITWEGARSIFPSNEKSQAKKDKIRAEWDRFMSGEQKLEDVQKTIKQNGKDLSKTDWAGFVDRMLEKNEPTDYISELPLNSRNQSSVGRGEGERIGGEFPGVEAGNTEGGKIKPQASKGSRTPAESKKLSDKVRAAKISTKGKAFDATVGLPVAVWNGAVEAVAKAIDGGLAIADAIKKGLKYIQDNHRGAWNKKAYNDRVIEALGHRGITVNGEDLIVKDTGKEYAEVVDGFYSDIEQSLLDLKKDNVPAKEWIASLGNSEEANWTGLTAWLNTQKGPISKKAIREYLKENKVSIVEVVNGEESDRTRYEQYQLKGEKQNYKEVLVTLPDAIEQYNKLFDAHSKWLKSLRVPTDADRQKDKEWKAKIEALRNKLPSEVYFQSGRAYSDKDDKSKFYSTHFSEPNILVHLRMNNRTDVDGNKVLFLEEIQSDWGQQGKKLGFKSPEMNDPINKNFDGIQKIIQDKIDAVDKKISDIDKKLKNLGLISNPSSTELKEFKEGKTARVDEIDRELSSWKRSADKAKNNRDWMEAQDAMEALELEKYKIKGDISNLFREIDTEEKMKTELTKMLTNSEAQRQKELDKLSVESVPQGPYVTDTNAWAKLGLKVALKQAVNQGAKKLLWSTGTQQFDRWGSEKIDWQKAKERNLDRDEQLATLRAKLYDKYGSGWEDKTTNEESQEYKRLMGLPKENQLGGWSINIEGQVRAGAGAMDINKKALSENGITVKTKEDLNKAITENLKRDRSQSEIDKLTDRIWKRMQTEESGTSLPRKEGMESFYGNPRQNKLGIVGEVAKAMTGQEPGQTEMIEQLFDPEKQEAYAFQSWIEKTIVEGVYLPADVEQEIEYNSDLYKDFKKSEEYKEFLEAIELADDGNSFDETTTQNSIEITPELKNAVEKGLPMFGTKIKSGVQASKAGGRGETATVNGVEVNIKPLPGGIDIVDGFYSPLEKKIVEFKQPNASANKWKEILGTKSDEAQFSGLADWLNSKRPDEQIKKTEIQQFIKDNRIEIKEIVKTEEGDQIGGTLAKFSSQIYNLPGEKKNYKEILITLPNKTKNALVARVADLDKQIDDLTPIIYEATKSQNREEMVAAFDKQEKLQKERNDTFDKVRKEKEGEFYYEKHYDEANILVHTRTDIRYDSNGNKVLFVEEVQSDWGQTGKKDGFKQRPNKLPEDFVVEKRMLNSGVGKPEPGFMVIGSDGLFKGAGKTEQEAINQALDRLTSPGVSAAPYIQKTNAWAKLGLKIALKQAVAAGAKSIAWTTGEQQIARYDLRKQVDTISYKQNPDGTYDVNASKEGVSAGRDKNLTPKKLEAALGKDIAQRIVAGEGRNSLAQDMQKDLTGEQLAFGGAGMKAFYGNEGKPGIVGETAIALVEELTGKKGEVKEVKIDTSEGVTTQDSIEITPALAASVKQGMPQFSKGGRENLAPNGKPSNLTEFQYEQVRTPEFKKWFGDWENDGPRSLMLSKVLDENGEPMVTSHVSKKKDIDIFDPYYKTELSSMGYHFGTEEQAKKRQGQYDFFSKSPEIGQYYLNIKNPIRVSHMGSYSSDHIVDELMDQGIMEYEQYEAIQAETNYHDIETGDAIVALLKEQGYDGLVYDNEKEGEGDSYVPFDPNQIKSATKNTGAFSSDSNKVQESKGKRNVQARNLDTGVEYNKSDDITSLKKAINNGLGDEIKLSKNDVKALSGLELTVFSPSTVDNVNTNVPIIIIKKRGHPWDTVAEAVKYLNSSDSDSYDTLSDYFEIVDGRHRIKKAISNDTGLSAIVVTEMDYEKYTSTQLFSDRANTRQVQEAIDYVYDNIAEVDTLEEAINALKEDSQKLKTGRYLNEENAAYLETLTEESMFRNYEGGSAKATFSKATDLFYQIRETEGATKKKRLVDERKALMDWNPSVKYIDDNIKNILDQLEKNNKATRKGNCP